MNFGQAFEEVKKGKGMRLPSWQPDVVVRSTSIEFADSKEGVLCCTCTDIGLVLGRDLTEEEETKLKESLSKRLHEQMTAPFLYVESRFGRVPWKETMIELFSEQWEVVE